MRSGRAEDAGDQDISQVPGPQISAYLVCLRTEYQPHRFGRNTHPLSGKTLRNVWVALSSFFRWAEREPGLPFPWEKPGPLAVRGNRSEIWHERWRADAQSLRPFRGTVSTIRHAFAMRRPTGNRELAPILAQLDTGIRISDLC